MYADQDLLQFDDVCLELDPGEVVTARIRLAKFAISAIICCLYMGRCAAY
jgi:hypothetical protein